jgi:DNA mismatch endonuclease (patch repair protein)
MRRVGPKDSKAERAIRSGLHAAGLRFRLQKRVEGVRVDIAFPGARVALMVDGCFWHGCPEHATYPKTNRDYWLPKLEENRRRDEKQSDRLRRNGWLVIRIWEHECVPPRKGLVEGIVRAVRSRQRARPASDQSEASAS